MARARRRTLRPPGSVPSVARPRSMQASITDQSRSRPASRVAWPPAVSLARFIAAMREAGGFAHGEHLGGGGEGIGAG